MKLKLKVVRNVALITAIAILASGVGYWFGTNRVHSYSDIVSNFKDAEIRNNQEIDRYQPIDKPADMHLFWEVWEKLESEYLFKDKIDYNKMVYGAISGMTSALGDPYTMFLSPQINKTTKENLSGAFEGVGIQLGYKKGGALAVIAPISGMPAEKAGVKSGDYILKIVDEGKGINKETYDLTLIEAVEMIRGEKGTKVKLTLLHDGDNEPYEVEIARETIIVPSAEVKFGRLVDGVFIEDASASGSLIAHLKLNRFGERTDEQWDQAVDQILKQKKLDGIVLDVRNNPGGFLQGAINLAGEFLPLGKTVVKQEQSNMPTRSYTIERQGRLLTIPMVVLMNQGSASASEILAGALRQNDRAKLVGVKSFGKGTVQADESFPDGSGLHVTIAQWLTPNGDWIHEKGLEPDVQIELDKTKPDLDVQLAKAAEVLLAK